MQEKGIITRALMEYLIHHVLSFSPPLLYGSLFIGFLFSANEIHFATMFLAQQGLLDLMYLVPIALVGSLAGNLMFFGFGVLGRKHDNFLTRITDKISKPFDHHLHDTPWRTVLLTKFVYGLNCAIPVRAGQIGISFKKFLLMDAFTTAVWFVIVGALGYGSGSFFSVTIQDIKFIEIGFLIMLVLFFVIKHFASKYIKRGLKD
jgi:membrane protein DedA with SNARE-associated domain